MAASTGLAGAETGLGGNSPVWDTQGLGHSAGATVHAAGAGELFVLSVLAVAAALELSRVGGVTALGCLAGGRHLSALPPPLPLRA